MKPGRDASFFGNEAKNSWWNSQENWIILRSQSEEETVNAEEQTGKQ
jgi:hypothetical protein